MMLRGPLGSWCGYVGVPPQHPLFNVEYNGCANKHAPMSLDERIARQRKLIEETTDIPLKTMLQRQLDDNWFMQHNEWACQVDRDYADRCPRPDNLLNAHGGLTYSEVCNGVICHHVEGRPEVWWFGFDCAHAWDVTPGMLANSRYMAETDGTAGLWTEHLTYDPVTGSSSYGSDASYYRDVAYVKRQVEKLAVQLRDYGLPEA